MSWLTAITLTKEDISLCGILTPYQWHQAAWQCFPDAPDAKRDFLLRVNWLSNGCRAYILSRREPLQPDWCPVYGWAVREIPSGFLRHQNYYFDLLANPTRTLVVRDAAGKRVKNGKRIPLCRRDDQLRWLKDKAELHGFSLISNPVMDSAKSHMLCCKNSISRILGVRFRGKLHVTNPERFSKAFYSGIGKSKAFGFGMLMLQPC